MSTVGPGHRNAREQIVELIGDSIYHALGLKETLQDERKALETQDLNALRGRGRANRPASSCAPSTSARTACARTQGLPGATDQMQALVEWCDEDGGANWRWQLLVIALRAARST